MLSTVHFCYPGYWIWLIPLRDGVISVGVVGEKTAVDASCRTPTGFRAFLDGHGALRALLASAELARLRQLRPPAVRAPAGTSAATAGA